MKCRPRLLSLILAAAFCCLSAQAWGQNVEKTATADKLDRKVNFGVRAGFNSTLFIVSDLTVNGNSISETQNNYKIGYFAAAFVRINLGKTWFLQPEMAYNYSRTNMSFDRPLSFTAGGEVDRSTQTDVTSKIHSLEVPVLFGYNIVKQSPYSMSVFAGPKFRYLWNTDKNGLSVHDELATIDVQETLHPVNVSLTLGASVTISRIFFDFRYDIGLHNISRSINLKAVDGSNVGQPVSDIHFNRRENILSFSVGVFL